MDNSHGLRAEIIGYDSSWGCENPGCEDGPEAVDAAQLLHALKTRGVSAKWRGPLGLRHLDDRTRYHTKEQTLSIELECLRRLAAHVRTAVENNHIPIVIGGDHSSAIGTWSGVVAGLKNYGKCGLIWLDAHMDSHTYETSATGKWGGWWHGQPVSALLGHGLPALRQIGGAAAKLAPGHVSLIGIHSYEPAEEEFLTKHGVSVDHLEDVEKRGFGPVFAEALRRATEDTTAFGLSIDLDAFRAADAPGVSTNEDGGLVAAEVLPIIRGVGLHPMFRGLEIAEFNPRSDKNGQTARLIEALAAAVFTKD